ncbi:phage portal protein [Agathobaculum sp. NTUH-O15-33]|uniref:phage portal protein n=1 Tax=Agathobaculum sp. NTUH-O15-33 TaxID=3079302 RepID=UPI002958606E|nr:phage portal protein [Agathobaculum sp. NTUH-O15-33]WNX85779.1 phage portal protein [Agathobaculum sp. NTUH-O15-33]
MIASRAMAAGQSVTYTEMDYDAMLKRIERIFSLDADDPEKSVAGAERLSPVAGAHRIFTSAMSVIPIALKQKKDGQRLDVCDPYLDRVLHVRMNDTMSPALGKKVIASQSFWHGLGAAYIERDGLGNVIGLIPLPSDGYQYMKDSDSGQVWYAFSVDGMTRKFQPGELILTFFETYDAKKGRGVLDLARDTIATDRAAQRYLRKFYANGGRLSGVLEVDTDADKTTRERIRDEFQHYASGMDNVFKVALLDRGMKYTSLGISQADAQFIESRGFSVEEISRFTGIPEFMLQSGKQSYNSNEQQQLVFVTNAIVPHVTQWEQEFAYKLYHESQLNDGCYMRANVSALMRGDDATRSKFYQTMVYSGILNPDECRALEERNPQPNGVGGHFFITKNLDTIDHVVKGVNE